MHSPQRPARWKAQRNFTLKCSVLSGSFAKDMSFMGCSNVSRHNQLPLSENEAIISPLPGTQAGGRGDTQHCHNQTRLFSGSREGNQNNSTLDEAVMDGLLFGLTVELERPQGWAIELHGRLSLG